MADSDNDVILVRNDDIDDIGPAFVNAPVIMKRFAKVLNEKNLYHKIYMLYFNKSATLSTLVGSVRQKKFSPNKERNF